MGSGFLCVCVCVCERHLNSYSLEKTWVPERKFHHLFNLGQLLPAASDVVVADVIQALLLILSQGRMQGSDEVDAILCH